MLCQIYAVVFKAVIYCYFCLLILYVYILFKKYCIVLVILDLRIIFFIDNVVLSNDIMCFVVLNP